MRFNPYSFCMEYIPSVAPRGADGERGEQGKPGERGAAGQRGEPGPAGRQGEQGQRGEQGSPGRDGLGLLSGAVPPSPELGQAGEFYIDFNQWTIYGPKGSDGWPDGVSLIGPRGLPGRDGIDGLDGECSCQRSQPSVPAESTVEG